MWTLFLWSDAVDIFLKASQRGHLTFLPDVSLSLEPQTDKCTMRSTQMWTFAWPFGGWTRVELISTVMVEVPPLHLCVTQEKATCWFVSSLSVSQRVALASSTLTGMKFLCRLFKPEADLVHPLVKSACMEIMWAEMLNSYANLLQNSSVINFISLPLSGQISLYFVLPGPMCYLATQWRDYRTFCMEGFVWSKAAIEVYWEWFDRHECVSSAPCSCSQLTRE